MTGLEDLTLAGIRVSSESASHLERMDRLKRLRISRYQTAGSGSDPDQNLVSDETIAELRRALPNCRFEIFPPDAPPNSPSDAN